MKILQVCNKMPIPARDGGSIASYRLIKGLQESGHQVVLLAMNTSKHFIDKELWQPIAKQDEIEVHAPRVETRVNLLDAASNLLFSNLPYNAKRFVSSAFRKELIQLLQNNTFDLIILENLYTFLYLKSIKKYSSAPIVMRAHNIEHEIWSRTAAGASGLQKLYLVNLAKRIRNLELKFLNQYDILAPITERDLNRFNDLGNHKPAVTLPTGIILNDSLNDLQKAEFNTVAHLGALDWTPNQEGLVWFLKKVWPEIIAKKPTAKFHLAGRNAPSWFIKKVNLPGVVYHGEVKSATDFIKHFPLHVVPLWSGSGMRIKIIEALALGRVIITSPVGVEGIEAKSGVHLFIEDNASGFSNTILNIMENDELVRQISKNAFTFVRDHYENSKLVANFIRFIENEQFG